MDKALLAKIRKCLALAKSANEHEAAAALAKARELMDAHGVSESDITLAEVGEATARASRTLRPPRWENILAGTICHALKVTQFIDAAGDRVFVGRGPAAEVAGYAFAVLFRRLKAARSTYIKTRLKRCKPGRKRLRADVYCEAWAAAVFRKIASLMPKPDPDALVQQYLAERHPGLTTIDSRKAELKGGGTAMDWLRGAAAGRAVNLNAGVCNGGIMPPPMLT